MSRLQLACLVSIAALGVVACDSGDGDGDPTGAAGSGGGGGASGQGGTGGSSVAGTGSSGAGGSGGSAGTAAGSGTAGTQNVQADAGETDAGETDAGGTDAAVNTDAAIECNQDAPYECSVCANDVNCISATYTDNANGTVTSSCCGLIWQQTADPGLYDQDEAEAYCGDLSLAGATWRLPTLPELMSLVVLGSGDPTIDTVAFPSTPAAEFWSSTKHDDGVTNPWSVNFSGGTPSTTNFDVRYEYHLRCVH